MSVLAQLSADDLRALVRGYADLLSLHREAINRLNVYPVPDGDTGTNMSLTMASVVTEVDGADPDLAAVCQAISHGSLMGARGNSGVILSQILRGLAESFRAADVIDGATVAIALDRAATAAYGAVMRPVEGTILTVVRAVADGAAEAAGDGADLAAVLLAGHERGTDALARTPEMLPVLAEAGVVDSGGTGLMLLVDVALNLVDGRPLPEPPTDGGISADFSAAFDAAHAGDGHGGVADLRYEVMYFLEAPDEAIPASRTCGRRWGTRSSWSAATGSGTAMCTPTTSGPPSKPPSTWGAHGRSGSPTCSRRSRRRNGSVRPSPWCPNRRRSTTPCPVPSWPSPRVRACGGSSSASGCRGSSPAARP